MAQTQDGGTPPIEKRSMVSEELDIKKVANQVRQEMEKESFTPSMDILMLFAVEKLGDIAKSLDEVAQAFKSVKTVQPTATATPASTPKPMVTAPPVQSAPATNTAPVATPVAAESDRLKEVKEVLKEFLGDSPLLKFDDASSAQFIIIKPNGFLGGGNFPKIAGKIKTDLKGEYVSQGKESHFRVPKLKQ